jgi:heat shock protein HslJ
MKYILPIFLCILMAACIPQNGSKSELDGIRGTLQSLNGHGLLAGSAIWIKFDAGTVSGYTGCNYFTDAEYTLGPKHGLTFKPFPISAILCSEREGVMEQEGEFLRAIRSTASYKIDGMTFSLADEQGKVMLQYQLQPRFTVNPKDLLGITWQLVSTTGLADAELSSFTIQFNEDHYSGTTTCRDYEGTYEVNQDGFRNTGWRATSSKTCSEIATKADADYTNLLMEVWQYNVTQTRLQLYTERGEVLIFEAANPALTPYPTLTPTPQLPPAPTLTPLIPTTPPIPALPPLPPAIGSNICPKTLPSILMPGRQGRVSNESSDSIRVRAEAGFQAEQVGLVPPGGYFDVIDGPQCVDGVAWFHVNADNGVQGWMAEGSSYEYWVQPIVSDAQNESGPTITLRELAFTLPGEIGNLVTIADIPYNPETNTPPYSMARLAVYPLQNADPVIYVYSVEEYLYYRSDRRDDLEQVRSTINLLMETPMENISLISLTDSLVIGESYLAQAGSFASGLGYHAIAMLGPSDGRQAPKPYYVFYGFSSDMQYFVFAKLDVQLAFGQLAQATVNDFKPAVHLLDQIFGLSIAPNDLSEGAGEITACPGAPEITLKPGEWARVSGNPPLPSRIRSQPGSSGEVIGQVQPGLNVLVVNGPRCANGYTWWFVRSSDGLEGWAAEGDAAGYWLIETTVTPTPVPLTLSIRARIDGLSRLIIQENTVHWLHVSAAAPGRWTSAPTYINEVAWNPVWPDVPDSENRDCNCSSSSYQGIPAIAKYPPITLEVIQARGKVAIVQQPSQSNDYTLIVEFDDFTPPDTYGDDWYEIKLTAAGR